jgi:hypothetical protein
MGPLSPLAKWVYDNKYSLKYPYPKEEKATSTHFLLNGGVWKIPKGEYQEFLRRLAQDLQNGEKHYLCENRTQVFRFVMDLDFFEEEAITINQVEIIVKEIQKTVFEYFGNDKSVIICGSDNKIVIKESIEYTKSGFHLIWPKIWLTVETAKAIRNIIVQNLIETFNERHSINTWSDVVDLAIYEANGLRMVGCRKMVPCKICNKKKDQDCDLCGGTCKVDENRVYSPRSVLNVSDLSYLITIKRDIYIQLLETSIYNYLDFPETKIIKELPVIEKNEKGKKKKVYDSKQDESMVKIENFIKKNFKESFSKVRIKKLTKDPNEQKYYAEPYENFCMNVNRCHTSSSVYFQITPSGITQRCYCRKDSTEGRLHGPCNVYASKPVSLSNQLCTFLFGVTLSKKGKVITNMAIVRNTSTSTLDLGFTPEGKNLLSNSEMIKEQCRSIMFQLEKRFNDLKNNNVKVQ